MSIELPTSFEIKSEPIPSSLKDFNYVCELKIDPDGYDKLLDLMPKPSLMEIEHSRQDVFDRWYQYNQIDREMLQKQNPRTLILQVLSSGSPVNFKAILMKCLFYSGHRCSIDSEGLGVTCSPKLLRKYRMHLQALVKNGRVRKSKQRLISHYPNFVIETTYYSLRKRNRITRILERCNQKYGNALRRLAGE